MEVISEQLRIVAFQIVLLQFNRPYLVKIHTTSTPENRPKPEFLQF